MTPPRRPIDRSHIHRAEDIYSPGAGDRESIGEVGLGGEQSLRLLGPFSVAFNTPNFVGPDDNGPSLADIPAGSSVFPICIVRTTFDVEGTIVVSFGPSSADASVLASFKEVTNNHTVGASLSTLQANAQIAALALNSNSTSDIRDFVVIACAIVLLQIQSRLAMWAIADEASVVTAAFYSDSPPAAGAADIYVLVATPSE